MSELDRAERQRAAPRPAVKAREPRATEKTGGGRLEHPQRTRRNAAVGREVEQGRAAGPGIGARHTFDFRIGGDLSPALARAAKAAVANGSVGAAQLRRLQRVARENETPDEVQRMFLAGLLDEGNARAISRTPVKAGATVGFSLASIRAGMPQVKALPRRGRARPPERSAKGAKLARQTGPTSPPPAQPPRSHIVGYAGEQAMAFRHYRFEDGWAVVRGPSGAGGHGVTTSGEDGLFYSVRNGVLRIADNKAYARSGNVASATAIDPEVNLLKNLDRMITEVEAMGSSKEFTFRQDVLRLLRQTRAAIRDGTPIPGRVQLVVHNEYGRSTGVTARLRGLGVTFVEGNAPIVAPAGTARASLGLASPGVTSATASEAAAASTTGGTALESVQSAKLVTPGTAAAEATEAVTAAQVAVGGGAGGLGARALAVVGRVGVALVEAAVLAVIAIGLDYLRRKAEQERFAERMRADQPKLEARLAGQMVKLAELQRDPARRTVWANVVIVVKGHHTVASAFGAIAYDYSFDDAAFESLSVSNEYLEFRVAGTSYNANYGGAASTTFTGTEERIGYSFPLPYDPALLDPPSLEQRIRENEKDAAGPVSDPALQALYREREALIAMRSSPSNTW